MGEIGFGCKRASIGPHTAQGMPGRSLGQVWPLGPGGGSFEGRSERVTENPRHYSDYSFLHLSWTSYLSTCSEGCGPVTMRGLSGERGILQHRALRDSVHTGDSVSGLRQSNGSGSEKLSCDLPIKTHS